MEVQALNVDHMRSAIAARICAAHRLAHKSTAEERLIHQDR
jgi:hypothetical protein